MLAVVLYHFAPGIAPGGFLGVDLFFVLSGFLITSLLVTEWGATHEIRFASFWLRRARRLLPALFLVLAVVGVYEVVFASRVEAHHVGSDGLWSMVYLANWHFITSGQSYIQQFLYRTPSPLRHMWSLAIEEQFYLVWPLLVAGIGVLAKRRSPRSRESRQYRQFRGLLLFLCAGLGAASFVRMLTLYSPGADPSRVYYGTDTRAFIVLVGASLGVLSAGTPVVSRSTRGLLIGIGSAAAVMLGIMMTTLTTSSAFLYEGGYGLIALIMVVILAAAAQPGANPLARFFEWRALVGLGLISYGVYLWHWPIGLWVTTANTDLDGPGLFVLRCVLTLGAALASYYLVEMPIRRGVLGRLGGV
ncbi:MAG: acyltransferase family protein, partial [Acidimicrobiia bacterium]